MCTMSTYTAGVIVNDVGYVNGCLIQSDTSRPDGNFTIIQLIDQLNNDAKKLFLKFVKLNKF